MLDDALPDAMALVAPKNSNTLAVRTTGDESNQPVRYFLYADMAAELVRSSVEIGRCQAILKGNFGVDNAGGFIEITGFEMLRAVEKPDLEVARQDMDTWIGNVEAGGLLVGLFFSDPDSEGRMSEEMVRIHYSLLNVPFQIVAVMDPETKDFGIYSRPPRGRFVSMAFRWVEERPSPNGTDLNG